MCFFFAYDVFVVIVLLQYLHHSRCRHSNNSNTKIIVRFHLWFLLSSLLPVCGIFKVGADASQPQKLGLNYVCTNSFILKC